MSIRSWIIPVSIAVVVAAALITPFLFGKDGTKSASQPVADIPYLSAKGVVESPDDVEIASQASGTIDSFYVKEGDSVRKGHRLVLINDSKITAQLAKARAATREAEARLTELRSGSRKEDIEMIGARFKRAETIYNQARDEYLRQDRLLHKGATTGFERDRALERMSVASEEMTDAKANFHKARQGERKEYIEQAQAARDRAVSEEKYYSQLLSDHVILAPFDGVVTETYKSKGEYVEGGTPILRIINLRNLRIRAELEETDVGKVAEGQQVEILSDAFKDKVFRGEIYRVFPNVKKKSQKTFDPMASFDINTQTFYARLESYEGLPAGMTVTVRVKR